MIEHDRRDIYVRPIAVARTPWTIEVKGKRQFIDRRDILVPPIYGLARRAWKGPAIEGGAGPCLAVLLLPAPCPRRRCSKALGEMLNLGICFDESKSLP
jgi:hypothetical protein